MAQRKSVLVLGASGGIGGAIAAALLRHGWQVRGMARDVMSTERRANPHIEWVQGDAMSRDDVVRAASGVAMIVHAVNPPGYRNWGKVVLPMIDNTIAAARAAGGARIVLPGTIYNYDPARTPVIDANSPQEPRSRKGAIRVALEQRLADAAPEVPSLILRAGDFFGPGVRSSWFAQAMVAPGKPVARIVNPARGAGHSWAYLPDLAEAFARLMNAEDKLSPFERVQFEGIYDASGSLMTDALRRITGRKVPIWSFPWWLMRLAAPFGGFPREAAEIAQYWRHPVRFDNRRLFDLIGQEPRTDLDRAIKASLVDMGCIAPELETLSAAVT
ncbi:MAG: NAD(P)H-binding protein [Pseudomonadota bacterium]